MTTQTKCIPLKNGQRHSGQIIYETTVLNLHVFVSKFYIVIQKESREGITKCAMFSGLSLCNRCQDAKIQRTPLSWVIIFYCVIGWLGVIYCLIIFVIDWQKAYDYIIGRGFNTRIDLHFSWCLYIQWSIFFITLAWFPIPVFTFEALKWNCLFKPFESNSPKFNENPNI